MLHSDEITDAFRRCKKRNFIMLKQNDEKKIICFLAHKLHSRSIILEQVTEGKKTFVGGDCSIITFCKIASKLQN